MSPVEWYYNRANKQYGPIAPQALKRLAEQGELSGDDLVWRDGMEEWVAARKVIGLFDSAADDTPAPPPATASLPGSQITFEKSATAFVRAREQRDGHPFDFLLEAARARFSGAFLQAAGVLFRGIGYYSLFAAMAALIAFQGLSAWKANSPGAALLGVVEVLLLAVFQYSASRFSNPLARIGRAATGRIASTALFDCFALLCMAAGLAGLVGLSVLALRAEAPGLLFPAFAVFVICEFSAAVALNPEALHLAVAPEAEIGEEALAILCFLVQFTLRLLPVASTLLVVWSAIELVRASVLVTQTPEMGPLAALGAEFPLAGLLGEVMGIVSVETIAMRAAVVLLFATALPIPAYLGLLFLHVLVGVVRSAFDPAGKAGRCAERPQPRRGLTAAAPRCRVAPRAVARSFTAGAIGCRDRRSDRERSRRCRRCRGAWRRTGRGGTASPRGSCPGRSPCWRC